MLILLRLIHVLCGVFWAGAAVFNAVFLIPSIRAVGPAGGPVMQQIGQKRKLPLFFLGAGLLTVLSGLWLLGHDAAGTGGAFMRSRGGMTFAIGGALAIITLLIGIFVVTPAGIRTGKLAAEIAAAGKPPSPEQAAEMQRLQVKLGKTAGLAAGLLTLTTVAMAIGRYM